MNCYSILLFDLFVYLINFSLYKSRNRNMNKEWDFKINLDLKKIEIVISFESKEF